MATNQIKLKHSLQQRPSAEYLVEHGFLPKECVHARVAPSLISTKRRIEREKVKDVLRHWIEEWGKRGPMRFATEAEERRPEVRYLVRRFAKDARQDGDRNPRRWGRLATGKEKDPPTRAKVLGLRRFWERVGRETSNA
jgi:hypothetical protein